MSKIKLQCKDIKNPDIQKAVFLYLSLIPDKYPLEFRDLLVDSLKFCVECIGELEKVKYGYQWEHTITKRVTFFLLLVFAGELHVLDAEPHAQRLRQLRAPRLLREERRIHASAAVQYRTVIQYIIRYSSINVSYVIH